MKAGVVIDSWKLTIFKRRLDEAGYFYEEHAGPMRDTITLRVEFQNQDALAVVVRAANTEAAKTSRKEG